MAKVGRFSSVSRAAGKAALLGVGHVDGAYPRGVWPFRWKANFAPRCEKPVTVIQYGRTDDSRVIGPGAGIATMLELETKCRKCPTCLGQRAAHWRLRASTEYSLADALGCRTWFGTLTIRPQARFIGLSKSRDRLATNGVDYDALSVDDQFFELHKTYGLELTNYVKRVRKNSSSEGLRFLCVAEAHADGQPHYHMLVHEAPMNIVKHTVLSEAWKLGFCKWKLVNDRRGASYVTKYLAKDARARVRASLRYGLLDSPTL